MAAPWIAFGRSASAKMMSGDLPPSSSDTRFRLRCGGTDDVLPDDRRSGERHLVDIGVLGQGRADRLAEAGEDVDDPGRETDLVEQLAQPDGDQARLLGRLEHHRAADVSTGAIFQTALLIGRFHGTMAATTPTGSLTV